jgi:hypothetical protein
MAGDEFRFDGQLGGSQTHRLAGYSFGYTIHLKQHIGWTNHGNPGFQRTFSLTHSSLKGLLGEGFMREYPDPHLPSSFHVPRDSDTGSLDLLGIEPAAFHCLQSVFTERDGRASVGHPGTASAVHFAVLNSCGHHCHNKISKKY